MSLPKQISEFMAKYSVDADEIWEVRNGTFAIKHKALERVAAAQGIVFDPPQVIEAKASEQIVALCVTGHWPPKANSSMYDLVGMRSEWSIGEASPKNNKNAYCYAMAEKRGKDRVILKLLDAHGAIYSESELDEQRQEMTTLPKKDAKDIYSKMQREVDECPSRDQLKAWAEANKDRIRILPEDWQDILRLRYEEKLADLRNQEAA